MILSEYIMQKFSSFGISLSEAELLDIILEVKGDPDREVTDENIKTIEVAMIKSIPAILLRPTSVNESGFSISWDKKGIMDYYAFMCRKYKMKNELEPPKPKATFL